MTVMINRVIMGLAFFISYENYAQDSAQSNIELVTPSELSTLIGEWTASLTYLNYGTNEPYSLPADVIIKQGKDSYQLLMSTMYPNEPKANSKGKISLSKDGREMNKHTVLSKQLLDDGQLRITTQYEGKDNKQKALIRNIYFIGKGQFVMIKEVQFEHTTEWLKRNEYNYQRK